MRLLGAVLVLAWPALSAEPRGAVHFLSPAEGAQVTGAGTVRLSLSPADLDVSRVSLYVDDRLLCRLDRGPWQCPWDAGTTLRPHRLRAVALLADGSRIVEDVRTAAAGFSVASEVKAVAVPVVVTDEHGEYVKGLTRESFAVFEEDAPQTVTAFLGEGLPCEVVSAVDISGSMTDAMPVVRAAVKKFLGALHADDHVTLLGFNDNIFTLARRETSATARQKAVDRLAAWGGTALYDVILKSYEIMAEHTGRKALVVFTDGEDRSSHARLQDVDTRAETNDAPVYMIGEGRGITEHNLKGMLEHLSSVSGGRAFFTASPAELDGVVAQIFADLSNQYLLAYEPSGEAPEGSWRRIRVELRHAKGRIRARQGYRAVRRS